MKKLHTKGFTLIELLVVISIIGLLSSVVLAALNSARDRSVVAAGLVFSNNIYHAMGDNIIGMWNFDDITNRGRDYSGNGHNGTLSGSYAVVSGLNSPSALRFNGMNQYVDVGLIDIAQNITISTWVYSPDFSKRGDLVTRQSVNDQWNLFFGDGLLYWRNGSASSGSLTCNAPANNKWHNIVVTQTSAKVARLYIDGKQCNEGTMANSLKDDMGAGNAISIGAKYSDGWYTAAILDRYIDDVKIFNQSITASEVGRLYAEGLNTHPNLAQK